MVHNTAVTLYRHDGPVDLLRTGTNWALRRALRLPVLDDLSFRYSLRRLRTRQATERDAADVLDTAYEFSGAGRYRTIAPIQVRAELADAVAFVGDHRPRTVLEIGTANGGTLYTWCRGVDSVERAISVNLPGDLTPPRFLDRALPDVETHFVRGDSHTDAVYEAVVRLLDGDTVDFLFIDGDHTFEGVREDFERYAPLLGEDGLVAFHDIVTIERDTWNQVDEFWETVVDDENGVEFRAATYDPHDPVTISGTTVTGHGIGVLRNPDARTVAAGRVEVSE
jgi:cephalosporin hydroxylase